MCQFFAFFDFHLACLLITPLLAVNVAPPKRRLCSPKLSFFSLISTSTCSKSALVLVYERGLFLFRRFWTAFGFGIAIKTYLPDFLLINARCKESCNIVAGHKFLKIWPCKFSFLRYTHQFCFFSINNFIYIGRKLKLT